MFRHVVVLFLLLFAASGVSAEQLSFEGKASAIVSRGVSIPYPMLVEKVFVSTGQDVKKGERLLQFGMETRDRRGVQNELLSGGGSLDANIQLASVGQEVVEANARSSTARELASKGLASQADASKNARSSSAALRRQALLKSKRDIAASDFNLRLKELETYFGHKLKKGQKLPEDLYLVAPIGGTVIDMSAQARPEGFIGANGVVLTLGQLNPIQVQIQVYEKEITRIHVGQEVEIELPHDAKNRLSGKISQISWQPTDSTIAVPSFYFAYIDVENPNHLIKPGYKVLAHINVD